MFLKGHITQDLEPALNGLFILGKRGNKILLPAILDTGFNGELALPLKFKSECKLTPLGVKAFELANGHIVQQDIFLTTLIIGGRRFPVEATMTRSSTALVGMELIRNRIAVFNLKTNKITVE
ncbi:MAG: hypothetical protein HY073_04370 [Deltaproteobacteria bacterium]|nr:hypothetical protein [Deltaproteobacteria bacterium]